MTKNEHRPDTAPTKGSDERKTWETPTSTKRGSVSTLVQQQKRSHGNDSLGGQRNRQD